MQVGSALTARGWNVIVAGRDGAELLKRAAASGLPTVSWPFRRDFDLTTARAASRWMREHRPDALLVTTGRDIRSAGLAAKRHRIPIVWRMGPKPKNNLVHRVTGALVRRVIAPSKAVRRELRRFSWLKHKIAVIPNGVAINPRPTDEQVQAARALLGLPNETFLCLYVGRLMTGKGIDVLIDSFAEIHRRHPRAALWIVGTGPSEVEARARVAALGLNGIVSFTGYSTDPSYYFAACDLFLLPSRYESFSYVLLEAMLHAKPCITTHAGAIPEVVGVDAAHLIPPGDPAALAEAVGMLIDNPARRRELSDNGRQRVVEKFDLNKSLDEIESLFRGVIATA